MKNKCYKNLIPMISLLVGLCLLYLSFITPTGSSDILTSSLLGFCLLVAGIVFSTVGCCLLFLSCKHPTSTSLSDAQSALNDLLALKEKLIKQEKLVQVGLLTAGIAHEIKNPLNFVTNFSNILLELIVELQDAEKNLLGSADDKTKKEIQAILGDIKANAEKIAEHGKRAQSIVMNMLMQSRSEENTEMEKVDINSLLKEYTNLAYHGLRAQDSNFNIKIEADYQNSAGSAMCYSQSLGRVFLNILNNGMYASFKKTEQDPAHHPVIWIDTYGDDKTVTVRIKDNGIGIKPEHLEQIFEPFFTTKPKGQGTGLGLSISHDVIVKKHHGSINVDSKINKFTEFTITIPRNSDHAEGRA